MGGLRRPESLFDQQGIPPTAAGQIEFCARKMPAGTPALLRSPRL